MSSAVTRPASAPANGSSIRPDSRTRHALCLSIPDSSGRNLLGDAIQRIYGYDGKMLRRLEYDLYCLAIVLVAQLQGSREYVRLDRVREKF